MIEDKVTPAIFVFGFNEYFASLSDIQHRYNRFYALVLPDGFIQKGRAATEEMMILSREMKIVKSECQYAK